MKNRFIATGLVISMLLLSEKAAAQDHTRGEEPAVQIYYLEIVTPEAEATIAALSAQHGVTFGDPRPEFGNARTASTSGGGKIGVRMPLRDDEEPVVRPYLLVDDIDVASAAAEAAGAEFAMRATEIPGEGQFAIYFLGGIQHGLWQR